jgi:hypothetical protein
MTDTIAEIIVIVGLLIFANGVKEKKNETNGRDYTRSRGLNN